MGACNSAQAVSPIGQESKQRSDQIMNDFVIGRQLLGMLKGVSYTSIQAADLAKTLINGVMSLEKPESSEESEATKALFNQQNINSIKKGQLLYYEMLQKLKNKLKVSWISQKSKSFIYHTIANLKKQTKIDVEEQDKCGVKLIRRNEYKRLMEPELQQVVKYESIADKSRQIGEKIGFKFQSIKKQSQKMVKLLGECMSHHMKDISEMKYNLSESQVKKMAMISRQACNHYDNGVFVLLAYFFQSCKRLQGLSKHPNQIELLLKKAIADIYELYPPGQGLSSEHQELKKTLKELQNPKNYKKVDFHHQQIALTSKDSQKQDQVQKIITKFALIAEQCKPSFEELVKSTCLAKCVYFKIGLKYYPKNPNIKALTRIKEKMFFKKESNEQKKIDRNTVKQVLEKEESQYRKQIDEILAKTDKVQFKITDMVRGKCVFLDVADIIYSVNEIKKFVAQNPHFEIAEIESRFTNKLPISDVTLKIVIGNKIVAELQLTIQTNAAAYAFAHKIYELQRTKVFSKLKIVHNYFQESREEFSQLAGNALQLQCIKSSLSLETIKGISQYFTLQFKSKSFLGILQKAIEESRSQLRLQVSVDPLLQDLIRVAFNIALGKWQKEIGKLINILLKKEQLSPKLKSVALSVFFNKLYLPTQSENMQQFGLLKSEVQQKIYMEEFLKQYFDIQQAYKYVSQNQRLSHRACQLRQIVFCKDFLFAPIQLTQTPFISNIVIEQHCFQEIDYIHQLFNFYFVTRQENNSIYPLFSNYAEWLEKQIALVQNNKIEELNHEVKIVQGQYWIEKNQLKQAQKYLQKAKDYFKAIEFHQKVMECQILLAECKIKTFEQSLDKKNDYYQKNVLEKARILGLELKGNLYADSLWRIQQYLCQSNSQPKDKANILQTFTTRALEEMSRSKGKQFVYAIIQRWPEYEKNALQKPKVKTNDQVKYANMKKFGAAECEYLSKVDWINLTTLHINYNYIGALGCEHLCKANWKNLTTLHLSFNKIGAIGCEHLSKAGWKNITILHLDNNNIGNVGCQHLSKAGWENITTLNLYSNNIGDLGCQHLSKANWKNITMLYLHSNLIGPRGCEHLSKSDWKNLTKLSLNGNDIGPLGCEPLSKADWKNITTLYLDGNDIGDIGCEHLSRADWKNITTLYLSFNKIDAVGCEHLSKADWKNIVLLDLGFNSIQNGGCEYLSRADWKNLTKLSLNNNKIEVGGCDYLSKADWKKLNSLRIGKNNITDQQQVKKLFTQKDIKIEFQ